MEEGDTSRDNSHDPQVLLAKSKKFRNVKMQDMDQTVSFVQLLYSLFFVSGHDSL